MRRGAAQYLVLRSDIPERVVERYEGGVQFLENKSIVLQFLVP
jgi:hypothetical protein